MDSWSRILEDIERKYQKVFAEELSDEVNPFVLVDEFHNLADGFRGAADVVVAKIMESQNLLTAKMIPAALALYRHAAELNVKSMRLQLSQKVSSEYAYDRKHDLVSLWEPVQQYLESAGFDFKDGTLHFRVSQLIRELADVDSIGDRFRYPDSRNQKARFGLWSNLEALRLSAAELSLLNFGINEVIGFLESQKLQGEGGLGSADE